MNDDSSVLDRMFNHPPSLPGRIDAILMTRMNGSVSVDVVDHLDLKPADSVLEIGFGTGLGIERAAKVASEGYVAGVDVAAMMVKQATRRNERVVDAGRVNLRRGSVEDLLFPDETFDAAFSINSLHAWPDQRAGLDEIRRVLRPGGTVAIVLTKHAGHPDESLEELFRAAKFERVRPITDVGGACAHRCKPPSE